MHFRLLLFLTFFAVPQLLEAGSVTIDSGWHHLRNAEPREWSHFPEKAKVTKFRVEFDLEKPESFELLALRQEETKQTWEVRLNDVKIGNLVRDHNRTEHGIEVPKGLLKASGNVLEISTTSENPDDIYVGDIVLHDVAFQLSTPEQADELAKMRGFRRAVPPQNGKLKLSCVDAKSKAAIPCRFTIVDVSSGTLAFVGAESNDRLAVREGVVYTIDGNAEIGLSKEKIYDVYCGRGFEYGLQMQRLIIEDDEPVELNFEIQRQVDTAGLVACDTHLHTFEFDRHGDCTVGERLISVAGEGVELPVSTGHDKHIEYPKSPWFTPVLGCEVTTSLGHFNSFPVIPGSASAEHKLRPWDKIFTNIYATPGVKICILNHGRDLHRNYTPLALENFDLKTGAFYDDRKLLANGIEIINSGATQTDPMQLVHDWFALLKSGHKIAAVGASDSHTVNFAIPGQGRTYLEADDSDPAAINVDTAIKSFLDGKTWVSFGLLTRLDLKGENASVKVLGPNWTKAERVEIFRNGESVKVIEIPVESQSAAGEKFAKTFALTDLKANKGDFLCAVATGPGFGPEAPWWPMMPPYQPDSDVLKTYVFGMSPAVWIK